MIQLLSKYKSYIFSLLLSLGVCFSVYTYAAEPSRTLGFQGQFYTYNTPGNAPVNAMFTFYDSLTGGNVTGTPISKIIQVVNGYFGTTFSESDITGVDLNQQLYLEVSINGTTLTPRTTVNPTVSSLKSFGTFSYAVAPTVGPAGSLYFNTTSGELYVSNGTSWQLSGLASSTTQWVANGTSLNYMAGNVGIGTTTPAALLTLVDSTGGNGYDATLYIDSDRALGQQSIFSMLNRNTTDSNGNFIFMTNEIASGVGILSGPTLILNNARPTGEAPVAGETFGQFTVRSNSQSGVRDINRGGIRFWTPDATTTEFQIGMRAMNVTNGSTYGTVQMVVRNELGTTLVGIGTTTPIATLSVKGRGTATGTLAQFTDSTNTSRFTILDNGAIGIGTTSPEYSIDIANGAAAVRAFQNTNASGGFLRLMFARGTSPTAPLAVQSADRLSAVVSQGFDGTSFLSSASFETWVDGAVATGSVPTSMRFSTTPIGGGSRLERMRITNAGFMGLGVTDPDSKLTIIASSTSFANQFTLRSARAALVNGDILGSIDFSSNDTNLGSLGSTTASIVALANTTHTASALGTDLSFRVTNGATTSEALRILGNGNVGIGTTTPTNTLDVSGIIGRIGLLSTGANSTYISFGTTGVPDTARVGTGPVGGMVVGQNAGDLVLSAYNKNILFTTANGGGSAQMYISSTGNIGIGTSSPDALLHLKKLSHSNPVTLHIENDGYLEGATAQILLTAKATGGGAHDATIINDVDGSTNGSRLLFLTGSGTTPSTRMVIDKDGNVAIGTSTPLAKFHIQGGSATTYLTSDGSGISSIGSGTTRYELVANGSTYGLNSTAAVDGGVLRLSFGSASSYISGAQQGGAYMNFFVNSTSSPKMSILNNGNVGIGTTTPGAKLAIKGAGTGTGVAFQVTDSGDFPKLTVLDNGAVNISAQNSTDGLYGYSTSNNHIFSLTRQASPSGASLAISALGGIGFATGATSATTSYAMTIAIAGNVGIGTTTPGSKLTVVGAINSTDLLGGATTLSTDANGNIIRTPSDQKLKTNVETLTSALDKVNAMRGVSYNWIDTNRFGTSSEIGFIAQELETIVPEVVKSGGEYKSVNYQNLTALLTEAIKELSTKFTNLAKEIKTDKIRTKELCVEKSNGTEVCLNGDQVESVLQNQRSTPPPSAPAPTLTPAPTEEVTPPTEEPAQAPEPTPEPAPVAPQE